jgi:hypothetical protein
LVIQWKDIRDVFFLTTAHKDALVKAPSSRGPHYKIKPAAVLDYKYSVERSDQLLSHYSFERKTKLWRKLKIRCRKFSMKNLPKGALLASDGMEIQIQDQTSNPVCSW